MTEEQNTLLREWDSDLRVICHGHYAAAVHADRRSYALGVPVVLLSTAVGTSIFAALGRHPLQATQVLVGVASFGAAALAALQTFMKYAERAEKHRLAGAFFGSLLKEMEQLRAVPPENDAAFKRWGDSFRNRWDDASKQSPTIPKRIWAVHYAMHKANTERQR